jgi:hypothetical protein
MPDDRLPTSPVRSIIEADIEEEDTIAIDIVQANQGDHLGDYNDVPLATTPLLPPVMMFGTVTNTALIKSPLPSPTVAQSTEAFSPATSPIEASVSSFPFQSSEQHMTYNPLTPPLSTKASISSFSAFRPVAPQRAATLPVTSHPASYYQAHTPTPSVDSSLFSIASSDPNDEWSNKLGHANFDIFPEPYLPTSFSIDVCRQLRHDWDAARCNFAKQLVRTGEHYGVTSKTYHLTEEKWHAIDGQWKAYHAATIAGTASTIGERDLAEQLGEDGGRKPASLMRIPSLNDPRSEGKFPKLGDEDIVGPMEQASPMALAMQASAMSLQRSKSTKAKFLKLFNL